MGLASMMATLVSAAGNYLAEHVYPRVDQDCSKCTLRSLDLLHSLKLLLYRTAVATVRGTTPGDHRSITQDCGKSRGRSLDLLHMSQLILYCSVVTTTHATAPGNHRSITQDCSE